MQNKKAKLNLDMSPAAIAYSLFLISLGSIIYAMGVNSFVIPNKFGNGGVAGIAILVYYLKQIPTGTTNLVVNAILLIIGYKFVEKRTLIFTIIAMFTTSAALNYIFPPTFTSDNLMISATAGGVLMGLGLGLIIRGHGTSAGTDIIALIIKKYTGFNFSSTVFLLNMLIVLASSFVIGAENTIVTIMMKFVTSTVMNYVTEGFNRKKALMIVSANPDPIANVIIERVDRGITVFRGYGYYSRKDREVLYVVVSRPQVIQIQQLITKIDPAAFMTVTDVQEVIGQGFTFYNPTNRNKHFFS